MRREDYAALGGHMGYVRDSAELRALENKRMDAAVSDNPWPLAGRA